MEKSLSFLAPTILYCYPFFRLIVITIIDYFSSYRNLAAGLAYSSAGSNLSNRDHILSFDHPWHALSPTLSREKHRYTSNAPSAGEGVDRSEVKALCSIQDYLCSIED